MISRIELVEWATQEGYSVTADQIERWHKKGIIPAPVRCPTKGQTGSVWMYPDEAKHNLMLALQSDARKLEEMLIDVWIRGGQVSVDHLRSVLIETLKSLRFFVKDIGKAIDRFETWTKKKRRSFLTRDRDKFLATTNVMLHVLSSRDEDVIWGYEAPEETPVVNIADEVLGADQLRVLTPKVMYETSEEFWDDAKKRLNINQCIQAVKKATDADFDAIRPYVRIFERWVQDSGELSTIDQNLRVFNLLNTLPLSHIMLRRFYIIVMLSLYKTEETRHMIIEATDEWAKHLPRVSAIANYVRYMKQHPKLKKRRHWEQYLRKCDSETLANLREYHQAYVDSHPELSAIIAEFR